jgi:hypothetical protein
MLVARRDAATPAFVHREEAAVARDYGARWFAGTMN